MQDIHDFKKELDFCYRVDTYSVGNKKNVKPKVFEEFFVRGGENCILQFPNLEIPFCYVHFYENVFPYDIFLDMNELDAVSDHSYYSKLIGAINKMRTIMMVYDFCVGKLREIENLKERKNSPYFNLKYSLEAVLNSGDYDVDFEELGVSDKFIEKLNKRCEYLAYAGELEWKGIIKLSTMNKFHTVESLKNYVQEKNLIKNPEGKCGSKIIGFIGHADENEPDPLADCRDIESQTKRFQSSRKLKSKQYLKLADELEKEAEIVYVFACYAQEVSEKMNNFDSDSHQYKDLREEYKKSIDICKENGARISLVVSSDEFEL